MPNTTSKGWRVIATREHDGKTVTVADRTFDDKVKAQQVAEAARYAYDLHTRVVGPNGKTVVEFEV